ncbi:MAG: WD40/YVTN/BNR-like repeat-containing protein [Chitinophagaceae bacterium]
MRTVSFAKLTCLLMGLFLFSSSIQSQQLPKYDTVKGFYDYQKKMNAYFSEQKNEIHDDDEEEFEGGYEQWKRLEWYFSTRLDKNGRFVNMQQLKQDAITQMVSWQSGLSQVNGAVSPLQVSGLWTQTGPTLINTTNKNIGRINRLAFLNSDPNAIWAATAGGGLWKTSNAGTTWSALTDGLPNSNLSGVAVQQDNPNIIYILTGDGDGGGSNGGGDGGQLSLGKFSTGVLKSVNGGTTWNYTSLKWNESDGINGFKIVMHPSSFNILYVASSLGIYRSVNSGASWQLVYNQFCFDIEFKLGSPVGSIVYAGLSGGRVARSIDGGDTWEITFNDPDPKANRVSIAVTPANPLAVYALISSDDNDTANGYTFAGLYYSTNAADSFSWNLRASHFPNVFGGEGLSQIGSQQNYDHALAVNPFQTGTLVTGGVTIFRSTNGGTMLEYVPKSTNYHVDIHELVYSPASNVLYAACDGGIYSSTNDGQTWTPRNGNLAITQYYRISAADNEPSVLLGGAQDIGSHLRTTNTSVFEQTGGKDGADNAISASNSDVMYEGSTRGPFRYSNDHGQSFGSEFVTPAILSTNYSITADAFWITNIQVSPINHHIIFLGYMPVVKGSFNGSSWTFTAIGIKPLDTVSGKTVLNVAQSNANVIYAGDNNYNGLQKLWRTINGGTSWQILVVPYSVQPFTRLTINPVDPNEIWLTYGGFSAGSKVFHSENGGTIWNPYTGSLPNVPINCIVYDDNNGRPDDALYIGTDIGVFYRDNTLGDWIPFSNGLPVAEVTDLEISKSSGLLRAGTYGRGIWQTSLYTANCPINENFTANSHPPSKPAFISVTNTITSVAVINGVGANVQYKAGNGVTLNPGFRINGSNGAKFISYIGPCPGGGVPLGYAAPIMNGLSGYLIENK